MENKIQRVKELKKEKKAVILAHYYVEDEIQQVADYIGDSYYLSEIATKVKEDIILFCGVSFMAESAKILNPDKTVLMPEKNADCPMAHMAEVDRILEVREQYEDVAVVCYVNSSAELKAHSDVCVTSSNALKIVKSLPNKHIFFIPDENLGRFVAAQCPEKQFIHNPGFCHVHAYITADMLRRVKELKPGAKVMVHPECTPDVTALADYVGSTAGMIVQAGNYQEKEMIIGTEIGILYELKKRYPDKQFYTAGNAQLCPNMKKITLDKVIDALKNEQTIVNMEASLIQQAKKPLNRMLELAK